MNYKNTKIIFESYGTVKQGRTLGVLIYGTTKDEVQSLAQILTERTRVKFINDTIDESFIDNRTPWSILGTVPYEHGQTMDIKKSILKEFKSLKKYCI